MTSSATGCPVLASTSFWGEFPNLPLMVLLDSSFLAAIRGASCTYQLTPVAVCAEARYEGLRKAPRQGASCSVCSNQGGVTAASTKIMGSPGPRRMGLPAFI